MNTSIVNKTLTLQGVDTGSGLPVVDGGGSGSAITLSADGCTLQGFVATKSGDTDFDAGIKVISNSNTISGNTATLNSQSGIYLGSSSSNTISGNTVTGNVNGIYFYSSSNNTISGNTATGNSVSGFVLDSSSGNTISGNTATGNAQVGIYLHAGYGNSRNNVISGNTANRTTLNSASYLDSVSDNTISGNTATGNTWHGILTSAFLTAATPHLPAIPSTNTNNANCLASPTLANHMELHQLSLTNIGTSNGRNLTGLSTAEHLVRLQRIRLRW